MKIRFIIAIVILLFHFAHGQVTFQKSYGAYGIDGATCVRQTSDGGYITAGYIYGLWINNSNYIVKTDLNGDTLWTTFLKGNSSIGNLDNARQIEETADGGYIICGYVANANYTNSDITLIKLDANGNVAWYMQYDAISYESGISVCQTYDGGYIFSGTRNIANNASDLCVIKVDESGNIIWSKIMGEAGMESAGSIIQLPDSGYLVAGTTESFGNRLKICLARLNQNGSIVWFKTYNDDVSIGGCIGSPKVLQTHDGGYAIEAYRDSSGIPNTWFFKTDNSGVLLWSKMYSVPFPASMVVTSDSGFALAFSNQVYNFSDYDLCVLKTDFMGNISWCKVYGDSTDEIGRDIQQTSDGGFIVAGSKYYNGLNDFDMYLVKTDPNGNTNCLENNIYPHIYTPNVVETIETLVESSGYTSVTSQIIDDNGITVNTLCYTTGIGEVENTSQGSIYPNPSYGNFIVEGEFSQLEVINALGEIVFRQQDLSGKTEIDLSSPASGIYFCKLLSQENNTQVLKLILQ